MLPLTADISRNIPSSSAFLETNLAFWRHHGVDGRKLSFLEGPSSGITLRWIWAEQWELKNIAESFLVYNYSGKPFGISPCVSIWNKPPARTTLVSWRRGKSAAEVLDFPDHYWGRFSDNLAKVYWSLCFSFDWSRRRLWNSDLVSSLTKNSWGDGDFSPLIDNEYVFLFSFSGSEIRFISIPPAPPLLAHWLREWTISNT